MTRDELRSMREALQKKKCSPCEEKIKRYLHEHIDEIIELALEEPK